ncbi:low-density lipoprotein receptor class A domain-containing protein 4 isoform X1 [Lates japonicus]|uniref:Low-density lipoprotein receptor class A domain-containing protein 4 isoform X1 n=1 Tax=Lates japonicus TaxID=270547 RepID=A0AAD3RNK7_LATJO|nr:low-density lipoprotein receptor class A domain-containing protein 4 isoform X1 [Lates japonicus]
MCSVRWLLTAHWANQKDSHQEQACKVLQAHVYCVVHTECKFHCTNGNCLRLGSLICNQLNNCGDNSDEENCPVVTQHPPPGIFNCLFV